MILDPQLVEHNIRTIKMNTPGYTNLEPKVAFEDVKMRRENYMDIYETVDERDGSYVKIVNFQTYIVHNARGYLPQKVRLGRRRFRILFVLLSAKH